MAKIALIFLYLLCDWATVWARLHAIESVVMLGVFGALYALLATCLILASFIRNHPLRIGLAALFAAASVIQYSFEWTTQGPLTYEAFLNLYNATAHADVALAQHGHVMLRALLAACLLFLGIALPPGKFARGIRLDPRIALAAPLAALAGLTAMLYARGGEGSTGLPAAYPPIALAGLMAAEGAMAERGPRQAPSLARRQPPATTDIVLIVDESVSGNYLDINNRHGVRSGLLDPAGAIAVANFGYASSIHNCSANSNLVLRYGGTRDSYRQAHAHWPSIWRYAQDSGMRAVYIDGQSDGGALQNLMSAEERAEIDDFIQLDGVPVQDRDMRIADLLAERINNDRAELIYVNKVGAHFPLGDKYPETHARYQPTLPRGSAQFVSWSSDRTGFTGQPEEWVRYRNSYRNTLLWNVGAFFDRLFAAADMNRATIVYTSDHGQDLHERGNPGNNTHCGADRAAQEEGLIPLAIIGGTGKPAFDWAAGMAENHNGSDAFRIFPTVLLLMGYDRAEIGERYGLPLDEAGRQPLAYNVKFAPILGREPEYRAIDPAAIVDPPITDYAPRTAAR